jgi:XRE family transcriptional regulator, regulator of sulfur utilization
MPTERPRPQPASAFAEAVRGARERAGLAADEVAERVGIEPPAYVAIERGERKVDLELVVRLADALNLTAAELVQRAGL